MHRAKQDCEAIFAFAIAAVRCKYNPAVYRHCSKKTSMCLAAIHFRCRKQWPKENCVHCVIRRKPTHENP